MSTRAIAYSLWLLFSRYSHCKSFWMCVKVFIGCYDVDIGLVRETLYSVKTFNRNRVLTHNNGSNSVVAKLVKKTNMVLTLIAGSWPQFGLKSLTSCLL